MCQSFDRWNLGDATLQGCSTCSWIAMGINSETQGLYHHSDPMAPHENRGLTCPVFPIPHAFL